MQKGFYLDLTRCTSCYACVVACKAHHASSEQKIYWRKVFTLEAGTHPNVLVANISLSCLHCSAPACREVCPTRAIFKRKKDGLVIVNQNFCIGCRMCFLVCPFGIPEFGEDGKMQKCNFCLERWEKGLDPACVNVCPTKALHAGRMDELSLVAGRKSVYRLVRSTDPSFFISKSLKI